MGERIGCEVRDTGNSASFADDLSDCRENRQDVVACLPDGDDGLGVARELPKAYRLPVKGARGGADEDAAGLANVQEWPDIDRREYPHRAIAPVGGHLSP